jgi:glyoxylase-like metal-dependent hydrolase (beta-lactamase superfamily II)
MIRVVRVLAPNPGPLTLEGTNTWIVGRDPAAVIDPGPEDNAHLEAVAEEAGPVGAVLLTHHHPDHAPGAAPLARMVGAPVFAFLPDVGEEATTDGERITVGGGSGSEGGSLVAVHTPGHTPDHVAFFLEGERGLFTGDAVLGWGTSVIDPGDGQLAAYLRSLERMRALQPRTIYPGHGPVVDEAMKKLDDYVEHRAMRDRQIIEALSGGNATPEDLVPGMYAGVPSELHAAAAQQVLVHLLKLEGEGRVTRRERGGETRFDLREG